MTEHPAVEIRMGDKCFNYNEHITSNVVYPSHISVGSEHQDTAELCNTESELAKAFKNIRREKFQL